MRYQAVAATLLAVPVFAVPLPQTIRHTEIVTLTVPVAEDGFAIKTFELVFRATLEPGPCVASSISLNQHPLDSGLNGGQSSSTFILSDGQIIEAQWAIDCEHRDAEHLFIRVDSIDGEKVDGDVHFDVRIQRPHSGKKARPGIVVTTEPKNLARENAAQITGSETDGAPETTATTALFEISPPHQRVAPAEIPLSIPTTTGKAKATLSDAITPDFVSGAIFASLTLSILALAIMSCLCCFGPIFRSRREEGEKNLQRRHIRRERKAAARAARKQTVADFFTHLFGQAHKDGDYVDEEKRAEAERKLLDDSSDDESSVTDDLAGLRSVADMVGDMVAVGEGSAKYPSGAPCSRQHCFGQHHEQQQHQEQQHLHGRSTPEFYDDDESLPAYEEQAPDQSLVADGFQYQPTSAGQPPLVRRDEAWGDRLGYDK